MTTTLREDEVIAPTHDAPYGVREIVPGDVAYVTSSWLNNFRASHFAGPALGREYLLRRNRALGAALSDAYFLAHTPIVNELLARCGALVAHYDEDPDQIWGWIVGELHPTGPLVVHYVYVKDAFRGLGVASALYRALRKKLSPSSGDTVYSHSTNDGHAILDHVFAAVPKQSRTWSYVPYLAFVRRDGRRPFTTKDAR